MAAKELDDSVENLVVNEGVVMTTSGSGKSITYGQLTKGKEILETHDGSVKLKDPSEFRIMGKSQFRADAFEKVTGMAKYAGDIRLPGLMQACILRPPSLGATLKRVNTKDAEAMEGVQVVQDGDLVDAAFVGANNETWASAGPVCKDG